MIPNLRDLVSMPRTLDQQVSSLVDAPGWRDAQLFGDRPGAARRAIADHNRFADYVRVDDDFRIVFVNGRFGIRADRISGEGWLKFHIRCEGAGAFLFGERRQVDIASFHCSFRYQPIGLEEAHWYGDSADSRWLTIYTKPEYLAHGLGIDPAILPRELRPIAEGQSRDPVLGIRPTAPEAVRMLADLAVSGTPGTLRHLELEARAFDLLVLLLRMPTTTQTKLSAKDRSRIHEARQILDASLSYTPLIPDLARQVGVNRTKLRAGFKEMFGQTIVEYCQDRRLNTAWHRLLDRDGTISEIAYQLGYESGANFSTAFRRRFGVSPSQLRRSS